MFCNKCGKENRDGSKFCICCGNQMQDAVINVAANRNPIIFNKGLKALIVIAVILAMILIFGMKIFKTNMDIHNIYVGENQSTSDSENLCETGEYIYFDAVDGIYRADKMTQNTHNISDIEDMYLISATENSVYCIDGKKNCYEIKDSSSKPEKLFSVSSKNHNDYIFLRGKYNYILEYNGRLSKSLNSDKYTAYSIELNEPSDNLYVKRAMMYKDYLYIIMIDKSSGKNHVELIRISLIDGKKEVISNEYINNFIIADDKIVCNIESGDFVSLGLDGSNPYKYANIQTDDLYFFYCDGKVYYYDKGMLCKFDINSCINEVISVNMPSRLVETSMGLVDIDNKEIVLYDFNGNMIGNMQ